MPNTRLRPIDRIAGDLGILPEELEPYGRYKAKISPRLLQRTRDAPPGKYLVITAVNPTPYGEGKTVTTIGVSLGLNRLGKKAIVCLRQPSLGPVFGMKGGATGGGRSEVWPTEEINLHLTGDIHAVGAAHNLCAAFLDNSLWHDNPCSIDPRRIFWRRVMDINDRSLRQVVVGLGGGANGVPREDGFDITVASEVMAILALSRDLPDLRARLGRMVVALARDGKPVTADDLGVAGAMTVLLKQALKPNLLQTSEGTAAFIHTGPYANIAHGNSSIIADEMALRLADYCVTESGFGSDMGFEKFCNIKCRVSGRIPQAAGLVVTVRAMKMHGADSVISSGRPLPDWLGEENLPLLEQGAGNLSRHLANLRRFGVPAVVIINRFPSDTPRELERLAALARERGAEWVVVSEAYARGGEGAEAAARALLEAATTPSTFRLLYPDDLPLQEKIEVVGREVYGAGRFFYSTRARRQLQAYTAAGYGRLPVCLAKTQHSLSHDPALRGAPSGFTLPVSEVRAAVGAGFITPVCGDINLMPGLPGHPRGVHIDINAGGEIVGLT